MANFPFFLILIQEAMTQFAYFSNEVMKIRKLLGKPSLKESN